MPRPATLAALLAALGAAAAAPPAGRQAAASHKADLTIWRHVARRSAPPALFVRAADAAAAATLAGLGVRAAPGHWVLARLDAGALQAAIGAGDAVQLRAAPAHRPLSLESLQAIDLAPVAAATAAAPAAAGGGGGRGVLVGIIDTGVDLAHPAFVDADGRSRVVSVWDQDADAGAFPGLAGQVPAPFGYGLSCTAAQLAAGDCPLGDPEGHGTHVAGIAAGGAAFGGVAPAADIAVVRSQSFTQLADAVAYLTQLADAREQPLVVNISVGGQYGPHDGRTPLELSLDDAARPGRILVAAAGNDGDDTIHLAAELGPLPQRVELRGLPLGSSAQTVVEMWTAADAVLQVAMELWSGGSVQAVAGLDPVPGEVLHVPLRVDGQLLAELSAAREAPSEHSLVRHAVIVDRSQAAISAAGASFVLRLSGRGTCQAWVSQTDYSQGHSRFGAAPGPGWLAGDGARSIAVPATAVAVLAVGSYTLRSSWRSNTEGLQLLPDAPIGALSAFSSVGPTGQPERTGLKPDLCAPGSVVASARAQVVADGPDTLDAATVMMQGTSMASPHVAGAVALLLEALPELDVHGARAILQRSGRADQHTGALPSPRWGYGKLDAAAALQLARGDGGGCQATRAPSGVAWALLAAAVRRRRRPLAMGRPDC